jgi:hypothetical protein
MSRLPRASGFLVASALVLMLVITLASAQSQTTSRANGDGHWSNKKEEDRANHEWPVDIVETGERTGLGSHGCVHACTYARNLRVYVDYHV